MTHLRNHSEFTKQTEKLTNFLSLWLLIRYEGKSFYNKPTWQLVLDGEVKFIFIEVMKNTGIYHYSGTFLSYDRPGD